MATAAERLLDVENPQALSRSDEIDAALERARAAIAARDLKTALRWADRARRCVAESAEIDELLGLILLGLGETQEGLARLEAATRDAPHLESPAPSAPPDAVDDGSYSVSAAPPPPVPSRRRAGLWGRLRRWIARGFGGGARPRPEPRTPTPPATVGEAAQTLDARELEEARLLADGREVVLLVSHDRSGGVERFVQARGQEIEAEGALPLILRAAREGACVHLSLPDGRLEALTYDPVSEADRLVSLMDCLRPKALEIHHFIDHDAGLIERLIDLGLKLSVYIHDYSWICPRLTLITGTGRYCGEPEVVQCELCIAQHGSSLGPDLSTAALRARSQRWLDRAERIVTPTQDVATRLARYFPHSAFAVEPWEPQAFDPPPPTAAMPRMLKVAVIGAIGLSKGYDVLLGCVRDARARALPVEFVVVGFTQDDTALMEAGDAFVTGRYSEPEVDALIRRETPDVALFLSVWPETWCYCLTHALSARLPVVAFDLGAIAERLHTLDTIFKLLPLNAEPVAINNAIFALALERHEAVPACQGSPLTPTATRAAAASGGGDPGVSTVSQPFVIKDCRDIGADALTMPEPSIGLTASVQLVTLNKGLYSFSVQQATPSRVNDDHDLVLPAIQVAVAPGIASDQVEFMTGVRSDGAWLIDSSDILIAKVKVAGTSVLITSYSAPGLTALSINVERIDVRRPAASGPAIASKPSQTALPASPPIPGLGAPQPNAALPARERANELVTSGEPRFAEDGRRVVRTQITAHISMRGDVSFVDETWAGVMGERLPIEAFAILPLELLSADEIEYKALTEKGVETPWTSGGQLCGTRQMNLWLSGFAVRLKGEAAKAFDCSYRGSFRSGAIVGPLKNGAPLRASSLDDVLQAIQITITEAGTGQADPLHAPSPQPAAKEPDPPIAARAIGPRFSIFREEIV